MYTNSASAGARLLNAQVELLSRKEIYTKGGSINDIRKDLHIWDLYEVVIPQNLTTT